MHEWTEQTATAKLIESGAKIEGHAIRPARSMSALAWSALDHLINNHRYYRV